MHESVFAASILKIVQEEVEKNQTSQPLRVEEIVIQAGLLSCLEPETLKGCFEIMAEDSMAAGARLIVDRPALEGSCPDCGKQTRTDSLKLSCPHCRSTRVKWKGGNEMYISTIKVSPAPKADEREKDHEHHY
ncbi:hydrogenase maturation nickel metallochaperone HypA [Desulfovibrio sp. OttesenSCG-928-C14]|nr:hydrogenase maturation nickel metallochaperone HypA [Desulfovibrio sp. OttesenSCG-928-C14]